MKKPLHLVFLTAGSFILTIALIETLLSFLSLNVPLLQKHRWIFTPSGKVHGCHLLDKKTIYRPTPNNTTYDCWQSDTHGFRITPTRNEVAALKILFVGDSFTFGQEVGDEEAYPYYIQQLLDEGKLPVRVFNGGVPGYGTDQQVLFLENYVLTDFNPDIVVWNINENDESDNDQACLFTVGNGELKQHPGYMNTIYLLGSLYQRVPLFVKQLKTFLLLFQSVPDRWTFGCSRDTQNNNAYRSLKTKLLLQRILKLSKTYHFKLVFTYIQSQFAYTANPPMWYIDSTLRQLTTIRSVGVEPIVVSDEIYKIVNERQRVAELSNRDTATGVLGESINDLSSTLFLTEPAQVFGNKHMNAEGNKEFARAVYQYLLPFLQNFLRK